MSEGCFSIIQSGLREPGELVDEEEKKTGEDKVSLGGHV